jgi:hypothetical protein
MEDWSTDLAACDVIAELHPRVLGLRAVCTSWDSCMVDAGDLSGWQWVSGQAVSPRIDGAMARAWPESSCGFDEWYFFEVLPPFEKLHAFCNWTGLSLAEAAGLEELQAGFSLADQLTRFRPALVVGDGDRTFLLARDAAVLPEFTQICERRSRMRCR